MSSFVIIQMAIASCFLVVELQSCLVAVDDLVDLVEVELVVADQVEKVPLVLFVFDHGL